MDTSTFLSAVQGDMQALTAGDEAASAVAERLSRTLESSIQLRLFDAIGQLAVDLSDELPAGHVEVRLTGREVGLVFVAPPEEQSPPDDDDSGIARLTLRMPETLKARVERAAERDGVSTNAWLVRAVSRGLEQPGERRRVGSRITGLARG
jgi:hypothetical protein